MARTKKAQSTSELPVEMPEVKIQINDNANVTVVNLALAGTKVDCWGKAVEFNEKGEVEVEGSLAKKLISISSNFSVKGNKAVEEAKEETASETVEE